LTTQRKTLKIISFLTVCCFLVTQISWATPESMGVSLAITDPELPFTGDFQIPEQLGTISHQNFYESRKTSPELSRNRTVILIQNAHANYSAQVKIRELLRYLDKTYGINTVFVEGG